MNNINRSNVQDHKYLLKYYKPVYAFFIIFHF